MLITSQDVTVYAHHGTGCHGNIEILTLNVKTWLAIMTGPRLMLPMLPLAPMPPPTLLAAAQGLTLVHLSAQHKRCLWDRGAFRGFSRVFRGCQGVSEGIQGVCSCQKRLRLS